MLITDAQIRTTQGPATFVYDSVGTVGSIGYAGVIL